MKKALFMLMAVLFSLSGISQEVVTVGDSNAVSTGYPLSTGYVRSTSQSIYTPAEIGSTGAITSLGYYVSNYPAPRHIQVYMGETSVSSFATQTTVPEEVFTLVYDGVFSPSVGWSTIELDDPFIYSGDSNLVIAVLNLHNGSWSTLYEEFAGWNASDYMTIGSFSDYSVPSGPSFLMGYPYVDTFRPTIQLGIMPFGPDFCYAPGSIIFEDATTESLTITWGESESATSYNLQIKTASESWDSIETVYNTTSTSYTFVGLTPSTAYDIRIQSDCGSSWKKGTFKTECGAINTLPWFEDFEGYQGSGMVDFECWNIIQSASPGGGPYVYCGMTYGTHSGQNYMRFIGTPEIICLPAFEEPIYNLRMSFWTTSSTDNNSNITLEVGYMDPSDPNSFVAIGVCEPADHMYYSNGNFQGPFSFENVEASEDTRIALRYTAPYSEYPSYWNIDDVTVEMIPDCPEPTGVKVSLVAGHSARLNWNEEYDNPFVEYRADGDEEWQQVIATDKPFVLTGLEPLTTYQVRLQAPCEGLYSLVKTFTTTEACPTPQIEIEYADDEIMNFVWNGDAESYTVRYKPFFDEQWNEFETTTNSFEIAGFPLASPYLIEVVSHCGEDFDSEAGSLSFYTYCTTITQYPWIETFESYVVNSDNLGCWTSSNFNAYNVWVIEGSKSVRGRYNSGELISPVFDLSSMEDVELSFDYYLRGGYYNTDNVEVYYRNSEEGSWTNIPITTMTNSVYTLKVALPNPTNYYQFKFKVVANGENGVILDNIKVYNAACPPVENITVSNITTTSANVSWTSENSSFVVKYIENNNPQAQWQTINADTTSAALTGLTSATEYLVKVISVCGVEESFGETTTFLTSCNNVADFPYVESFEDGSCWRPSAHKINFYWAFEEPDFGAADGNKVAMFTAESPDAYVPLDLVSPVFDLTSLSSPYISFKYINAGYSSGNDLSISYRTSPEAAWVNIASLTENTGYTWAEFGAALPNPSATYQLKFTGTYMYSYETAVDNVIIQETPSCIAPKNLELVSVSHNSADITWTLDNDSNPVKLYYKKVSDTEYTAVEDVEVSEEGTYTIEGLVPSTTYEFYLASVCDDETELNSLQTITFATLCGIVNEFPFVMDFENGLGCYSTTTNGYQAWSIQNNGTSQVLYSGASIWSGPYGAMLELISPIMDGSEYSAMKLTFDHSHSEYYTGYGYDTLGVYYRLSTSGEWIYLASWNQPISVLQNDELIIPQTSETMQVRFLHTSLNGNGSILDNIIISPYSGCLPPTDANITSLTTNSASITVEGSAEQYTAMFRQEGTTQWLEADVEDATLSLEALDPATTYEVKFYSVCDEELSESYFTMTFTTMCLPVTNFPWTEDVEGGFGCWTTESYTASGEWLMTPNSVYTHGGLLSFYHSYNVGQQGILISPVFDLVSIENPTLSFFYLINDYMNPYGEHVCDSMSLVYRTGSDDVWQTLRTYGTATSGFVADTVALPSASDTYQFGFIGTGRDGNGVFIDDLSVFSGDGSSTPDPCTPTTETIDTAVCQNTLPFTWNGQNVDAAGQYTYTTTNAEGCEHVITMNVTVNPTSDSTLNITLEAGQSYLFNGETLSVSTTRTATFQNALGCDSVVTLILTVGDEQPCIPTSSTVDTAVCQTALPFTWNGQNVDAAGTFTYTTTNAAGCDSTVTLNVTLLEATTEAQDTTVCPTDFPFTWNEQNVDAVGEYTYTTTNEAGCEHVITLTVNVYEQTVAEDVTVTLNNADLPYTHESGLVCDEFATYEINAVDENGCSYSYNLVVLHNEGLMDAEANMSVTLYPNPTSGDATLSIEGLNEEATILVTDVQGRVISTSTLANGETVATIETSNLPAGVYYVRVLTATTTNTQKLIKK